FHDSPRSCTTLQYLDPIESGTSEGRQERSFNHGPGDAAAPQGRVFLQVCRNLLIGDDVGNDRSAAILEHTIEFGEEFTFVFGGDKIQNAVGDHHVNG